MKSSSVFAVAGMIVLAIGLVLTNMPNAPKWLIPSRSAHIAYGGEVPYYVLAAVFCLIALIESIWTIPLSKGMMAWHTWLSMGSALLFVVGTVLWLVEVRQPGLISRQLQLAIIAPIVIGVPVFIIAQAWFCGDLVRALIKART